MKYDTQIYYPCYSLELKKFLVSFDFPIEYEFVHVKTGKTCYIFKKTPKLSIYLQQWTANKNNTKKK